MSTPFQIDDEVVFPAGHGIPCLQNVKITGTIVGNYRNLILVGFNDENYFDTTKVNSVMYLTSKIRPSTLAAYQTSAKIKNFKYTVSIGTLFLDVGFIQKPNVIPQSKILDLSDWRTWRSQAPGQCACGMTKSLCTYHKD